MFKLNYRKAVIGGTLLALFLCTTLSACSTPNLENSDIKHVSDPVALLPLIPRREYERVSIPTNLSMGIHFSTLSQVNEWVNSNIVYTPDTTDTWQSPLETLTKGSGDCEDLAILKQAIVKENNLAQDTKVILVTDRARHNAAHAILYADGKVLDNQVKKVKSINAVDFTRYHLQGIVVTP